LTNDRRTGLSKRQRRSADGGRGVEGAERGVVHEGQPRQGERLRHLDRLRDHQEPALVVAVDDHAGPGRQQEDRAELAGGQEADGHPAPGAVKDQEGEGDHRQPVAAVGDRLADEEQPEVPGAQ